MVDSAMLAAKLAIVRDAVNRIAAVLPPTLAEFRADRSAREIVTLNLFVAIQECLALASHILADAAWGVPKSYAESFTVLADHDVIEPELAARMRSAAGLRNLLAHQYGIVDFDRLYEFACDHSADLTAYSAALAAWIGSQQPC